MNKIREYAIEAQKNVVAEMAQGTFKRIEFSEDIQTNKTTIGEMIGTDDGDREFIEKITYDAYSGRENIPLIYKSLYSTITDTNLPKTLTAKEFGPVQVVFLEKFEGGEIKFGSLGAGPEKVVSMHTWAAGVEYDEDIVEYNQTWRVTDIGVAFGEAYNKLLNHLHLSPIISGAYVTTGGGLSAQNAKQKHPKTPAAQLIAFDTDIKTTLQNALQVLPKGSIVIHNSFDSFKIQSAIAGDILADLSAGPVKTALSNAEFIAYDGATITVEGKTYTYEGVTAGFLYLAVPKVNFKEYIKHELRVDNGDGDMSRLILDQIVGRSRRGVLAGLSGEYGVIKVDISA